MKKRFIAVLLVMCIVLGSCPVWAVASNSIVDSGTCGNNLSYQIYDDNLTWQFYEDGLLIIQGEGEMGYFDHYTPWDQHKEKVKKVQIESGVNNISVFSFQNCTNLTEVSIPATVTAIGGYAFENCAKLKSINIPNGIHNIMPGTFHECTNLNSISLPVSLRRIQTGSFTGCNKLFDIFYSGSSSEWYDIQIDWRSGLQKTVRVHYNSFKPSASPTIKPGDIYTPTPGPIIDDFPSEITPTTDKTNYNGHTYQVLYSSYGWDEMQAYLETTGGYLACITSAAENQWIYNYAAKNVAGNAWFGYSDTEEEGNWKWVSGETSSYTNWAPGEPNNEGGREHYAGYHFGDGTWNDGTYPSNCYYLCEWPRIISSVVPVPTIAPVPTISPKPTTKPTTKPTAEPTTPPVYDTELTQLASQWTRAYDQYTDSIKTTLEKNAGVAVHGDNLDNLARKLESNYGAVVSGYGLTKEQKVVVYKALLKMLAQETGYQLDFSGVKMDKLDKVPSAICTAVANGIGSSTYTHTEAGGKKVEISLSSNFGTNFGLANYYEKGKFVNSVVISTTKKDVEKIVSQYMTDLLDMEADALQQAAKEAYKDLSKAFFGATPDSFSKKIVKSGVEKISAKLAKYKLGDVAKIAANCYNYYGFIKGIQKGESTEKLLSMLAGQTDITFSDPNAKEIATQKALKLMEKTRKEIEKKLKKEPTGIDSFFAKILGWRVSDFNCPINIAVYDGANNQVGYIGDDNEWFDEEIIYIERNGDTKTIYSKEPVSFKVTGTDYGTLNYTVEEFKNGVPVGRTNFFDIDLYEGINIDISVPDDAVSGNSLDMVVDGTTYLTLDNISADEYDTAKVTINGYAESSVGGIVSGFGEYVKGDTVKLLAQANVGYVFLGWKDSNGNLIGVSPTLELIAKKNSTYAAQFEKPANPDNPEDEPTAIPEPTNTPTPTSTPAPTASPIPEPTATPNPAETTFPDVPQSAYYYEAVKWAVGKKIVAGYPDGRFKPDNVCTRAEAMMIFYRAVGSPDVQLDNLKFTDVGMNHWANTAICWAVEHGITSGTSSNTFSPNNKLTRAQAMTFLYRMAGSPQISGNNPFKDIKSSSYYYNPVMWAVDTGITAGTSKTQFSPNKDCTRAQIVTFLYRYLAKATESPNRELTEDECWKIATAHWNSLIVPGKTTVFHASKKENFYGKTYYHYYLNQFVDSYWSTIDYLFVDISNGDCYFGVQRPEYKV